MKAFLFGLLMVAAGLYLFLPTEWALGWYEDVLFVLKGATPIVLVGMGFITLLLGIADIRDKAEARREGKESEK